MSVPAAVVTDTQAFVMALAKAQPIQVATPITISVLKRQGGQLLKDIDAALLAAAGGLGGQDPTGFAGALPDTLRALSTASDDQAALSDMRGIAGRLVLNLTQAGT